MGDRHGDRFARRGRTLNPLRPQVDAHRGVGFRHRATVFRRRGAGCGIYPARERSPRRRPPDTAHGRKGLPRAETRPTAKASRHGARAKGFAPRRNTPHGEGLPTRRTGERVCPTQEHSPRRRPSDTAHERKDLPRARTLSSAKASRHGARAKGFAPRENAPHGEGLPTRRTGERICPAQEHAPRRRPPDTARRRRDWPRARTLSSAKASRHGARAKEFAPRRNTPHGEGLPTRRTSERICPARERSPRRKLPDTARERKDLPRGGSRSPQVPTNGRPLPTDEQPEKHTFGGVAPETARPLPSSFTEKK